MKKNPSIAPRPERAKPRSPIAMALSVALFPIWFPFWAYGVFLAAQFERTRDFSKWLYGRYECYRYGGFTLIELSIVLVIIGLIVGGVLTGQTLIAAAAVRAQISQIEKFNTAANTFFGKYGYLPGDIPAGPAAQFGFAARGTLPGSGDGNGILQGCAQCTGMTSAWGWAQVPGETGMFWVDLSTANLIEGNFSTATSSTGLASNVTGTALTQYFPTSKLNSSLFVYAFSPFSAGFSPYLTGSNATNFFGLSAVNTLESSAQNGKILSGTGVTVSQAYAIDTKIDDGFPQTGRVLAIYVNNDPYWTDGTDILYSNPNTSATSASATTCYDNGGVSGTQKYSLTQNNGAGVNCALSFRMQAGD